MDPNFIEGTNNAITALQKKVIEVENGQNSRDEAWSELNRMYLKLLPRIETLEKARAEQIKLNMEFIEFMAKGIKSTAKSMKSIWDFFKK